MSVNWWLLLFFFYRASALGIWTKWLQRPSLVGSKKQIDIPSVIVSIIHCLHTLYSLYVERDLYGSFTCTLGFMAYDWWMMRLGSASKDVAMEVHHAISIVLCIIGILMVKDADLHPLMNTVFDMEISTIFLSASQVARALGFNKTSGALFLVFGCLFAHLRIYKFAVALHLSSSAVPTWITLMLAGLYGLQWYWFVKIVWIVLKSLFCGSCCRTGTQ